MEDTEIGDSSRAPPPTPSSPNVARNASELGSGEELENALNNNQSSSEEEKGRKLKTPIKSEAFLGAAGGESVEDEAEPMDIVVGTTDTEGNSRKKEEEEKAQKTTTGGDGQQQQHHNDDEKEKKEEGGEAKKIRGDSGAVAAGGGSGPNSSSSPLVVGGGGETAFVVVPPSAHHQEGEGGESIFSSSSQNSQQQQQQSAEGESNSISSSSSSSSSVNNNNNGGAASPSSRRRATSRDKVPVAFSPQPPAGAAAAAGASSSSSGEGFKLRLRAGVAAMQGRRKEMEDAHQIADATRESVKEHIEEDCQDLHNGAFLGVFDGHAGSGAAEYAGSHLHRHFMAHPLFVDNPVQALKEAFASTESEICKQFSSSGDGTTAVVAYIRDNVLIVGHVGDSEAVLCRKGIGMALTEPHNAKANEKERQRIRDVGGVLVAGDTRVGHPVLNPMLFSIAVTRAMGDVLLKAPEYTGGKSSGLIAEPEILEMELNAEDEFLLLACDGVWDVLSHQACIDFVRGKLIGEGLDARESAKALIEHAYELGSNDNLTCIICSLRG